MTHLFLLQAAPQQSGGQWQLWLMMGLIFVVMYFFMIRPQQKKQKELKKFREAIKKGDSVVTIGGVYGKVNEVAEGKIKIEVDKEVYIWFDKSAVLQSASDLNQK